MKRVFVIFAIVLLFIISLFSVIADHDEKDVVVVISSDDGDSEEDIINSNNYETDSDDNEKFLGQIETDDETETESNETKTVERSSFIEGNGNRITIIKETKTKDDKEETEIKKIIITADGKKVIFKTKIEIEHGENETKKSVEIEGAEFETELEVEEETKKGKTKLKAKLSSGEEQEIIVNPNEAIKTAFAEIGGMSITLKLIENTREKIKEAVFSARTKNRGRFLGILDADVNLETLIDAKTGKVIKTNRPWWAFLVAGYNKAAICHVSEEDKNKRVTLEIATPAVKTSLAHGDSIGECPKVCGDGIVVVDAENCDDGNTFDGDGCDSQCQIEIIQDNIINIIQA